MLCSIARLCKWWVMICFINSLALLYTSAPQGGTLLWYGWEGNETRWVKGGGHLFEPKCSNVVCRSWRFKTPLQGGWLWWVCGFYPGSILLTESPIMDDHCAYDKTSQHMLGRRFYGMKPGNIPMGVSPYVHKLEVYMSSLYTYRVFLWMPTLHIQNHGWCVTKY